jgi:hypothetical protein
MKHLIHLPRAWSLATLCLVLLNACSRSFVGYRFQVISQPDQQAMQFECREATMSGQCNVSILPNPNGAAASHVVAVGESKNLTNAPLGASYCVSVFAINWSDCPAMYTLGKGTTTVESGRSER